MESYERFMDCLLDPAKCRLLIRLGEVERATARELAEACPHISRATLYRYLNRMLEDQIVTVAEERRVRGVTERVYILSPSLQADGSRLLREQGSRGLFLLYAQFSYRLMQEFSQYAKRKDADLLRDGAGFTVCPVQATTEELAGFGRKVGELLLPLMENPPGGERRAHTIATIVTPPQEAN